jgi:hypothetical protein
MVHLLDFETWSGVNESYTGPDWVNGGLVFIKGKSLNGKPPYMYMSRVKWMTKTQYGANMASLYQDFYIILKSGSEYTAHRIDMTPAILDRSLGMKNYSLALNDKTGKTPKWYITVKETSINELMRKMAPALDAIPDVNYYPASKN